MEIRESHHPGDLVPPPCSVRVADLDNVPGRVVEVHLALATGQLDDRRAVGRTREHAGSRGPAVDGTEVVDLECEVPGAGLGTCVSR